MTVPPTTDLIAADAPGRERRPYVVLNAADMASGSVFSFNQDQFDLICADLARLRHALVRWLPRRRDEAATG